MRVTYDAQHNIAYIRLQESSEEVETIALSGDVNVDLASDGTLFGIELLNANKQLAEGGVVEVMNGQSQQLELPG